MRGLLRVALLAVLGAALFVSMRLLDGPGFARRQVVLLRGQPIWGVVEGLEPSENLGLLSYRVSFNFEGPQGIRRAQGWAGEGVTGRLIRGQRVLVRMLPNDPGSVSLDDDYGYSRQRGALLAVSLALLVIGGWSFIFRVV